MGNRYMARGPEVVDSQVGGRPVLRVDSANLQGIRSRDFAVRVADALNAMADYEESERAGANFVGRSASAPPPAGALTYEHSGRR